jgi:hypothetical protein
MAPDSFRRWQAQAIVQKQTASTLLVGLSGAMLAFSISQISDAKAYIGFWQSLLFQLSAGLNVIAIAAGIGFTLNRVRDFDLTSTIARTRETEPSATELTSMRRNARRLGKITRNLYLTQCLTFLLATVLFLGFVIVRYQRILFVT